MTIKPEDQGQKQSDRRSDPRFPTQLEAVVEDAIHGTLRFTATRFSQTGAFLQRLDEKTPLPSMGSVIKLALHWPLENNAPPVQVDATVVRQEHTGVGVRFEIR